MRTMLVAALAASLVASASTIDVRAQVAAGAVDASSVTPASESRAAFSEPGISPGGDEIAFVSNGSIWSVPAQGGEARLLVSTGGDPARPLFAPDGKRLAFTSTRDGARNIYVADLSGETVARVTSHDAADTLDAWSRTSDDLYFDTGLGAVQLDSQIDRVAARGGTAMPVVAVDLASNSDGVPSPGGDRLAYRCGGFDQWWRLGHTHIDESAICVRSLAGAPHAERVTPGDAVERWPMWSADGTTIYYVSDRGGTPNLYSVVPGRAPQRLTNFTSGRVLFPTIDAAGDRIAFERDFGIWTYDVRAGRAAAVPIALRGLSEPVATAHRSSSGPFDELAVAPDGKKLAFIARGRVFVSTTAGDEEARAVSSPGARAREISWDPTSLKLAYVLDRGTERHVVVYDFPKARETTLTHAAQRDDTPVFSPDGERIAFVRGARELHVIDASDGGGDVVVASGHLPAGGIFHSEMPFAWAPAGDAIAYLAEDARGFTDLRLAELGGADRPLSFLADVSADDVVFAADGKRVFYLSGQRTEPSAVVSIDLVPRAPRFKEDRLRTLLQEEPKRPNEPPATSPSETPAPAASPSPAASPAAVGKSSKGTPSEKAAAAKQHTEVTYDGIRERTVKLPVGLDVQDLRVSGDGKSLLIVASVASQQNLYSFSIDDLASDDQVAVALTASPGAKTYAQFGDDKTAYYLDRGRISAVGISDMKPRGLGITAGLDSDFETDKMQLFDEAWGTLDEFFDDPNFDGAYWSEVRRVYEPLVRGAHSPAAVRRILSMMIGELNASHSGISAPRTGATFTHGRLGVAFDPAAYAEHGRLRIATAYRNGPAALAGMQPGDVIVDVQGTALAPSSDLEAVLDNTIGKRVTVTYERAGTRHTVPVLPIDFGSEETLHLRDWIAERREIVERASGGKVGYVYLPDMSADSLQQFFVDLDARNEAQEGVVIDVRNNNGGFIDPYVIDVLSRRDYLNFQARGDRVVPARAQLGQRALGRKTALLVDADSLSDAEDLTEGYRALHLGPVVGKPTAGWIIFTYDVQLFDGSGLRVPAMRVTTEAGAPLELHPRPVDIDVDRPLDEAKDHDAQLEAAVRAVERER